MRAAETKASAGLTGACSESVFEFDSRIRCLMVFGFDGRSLRITHRRKNVSLEPDEDIAFIRRQAELYTYRKQFANRYHGAVRALMVISEKLTLIAYLFRENLVIVTADPDFQLNKTGALGKLLERLFYWSAQTSPIGREKLPVYELVQTGDLI